MAIYRGMDIGTAKPSRELRELVPHHLIDIVDPADEFSVAQYVEAAAARGRTDSRPRHERRCSSAARRCISRACCAACSTARRPTGSCATKSKRSSQHVGQQALLRAAGASRSGGRVAHSSARHAAADPRARSLSATGEPISHQQLQFEEGRPAEECRVFVLRRQREELHQRIEGRVEAMVDGGLGDEVRRL